MGSEFTTLPNMQMPAPVAGQTTDPYWTGYILQCLSLLDNHDHSSGKGKRLSQASVQVTDNWEMSGYGITNAKFYSFTNPAAITGTIPNASVFFENGEYFIIDGSGNEIQLTSAGSLNASLIGGFTGDYATSGAFCRYVDAQKRYDFFTDGTTAMAHIAVGDIEIRNVATGKHQYGLKLTTSGNIASTFTWQVPDTQSTNVGSILNLDSNGTMTYLDTASFIRTTGAQTKAGVLTLSSLPLFTETNAPTGTQGVNKDHLDAVIVALDKTSVGLSNVDNTADSNKSVASAAALTTPRTINSVTFSGTNNITIPPGPLPSTNDGIEYVAKNGGWFQNTGGSFPEVTNDTNTYTRSYGAWEALVLDSMGDVVAPSPTTGDYLKFDGTNWVPAVVPAADQVSISVTANSNGITAGNVVELVSTGGQNVQNIYHCEAPTIGSLLTLDGTNNVKDLSLSRLTDTTVLAAWNDDTANLGQLAILTAGSPPTMSAVVATSTNDDIQFASSPLSATEVALSYNAGTNGATRIATISGTNVTLSTAAAITMIASVQPATCALTSSNWFVAYADGSSLLRVRYCISNTTNAPTLSLVTGSLSTNFVSSISLARTTSNTGIVAWTDSNSSGMYLITSDGTNTPLSSTKGTLDGTNECIYITQSPIDSNHTLCAYNNATTKNGMLAVIQANGTNAPTVVGRAVFSVGDVDSCSLSAHSASLYSLTYGDVSNDGKHIAINIDSNYNLTFSQSVGLQGTNDVAYNAVAALTPTTAICAFRGSGSDGFAGTLTLTPTPVISGQLVGIASTSATNGAAASVDVGPLVTGTYTSGTDYYAAGAGGLTTTATPVHVGKAKSTTELVLDLRGAPEAGKQQVWEITTPGAFTFTVPEDGEYEIVLVGAGGGGANTSGSSMVVCGANAGNGFTKRTYLSAGSVLTGSLGAGGAKSTINASDATGGGDSTIVVFGKTYTIRGGKPAFYQGTNTVLSGNIGNDGGEENIPGQTGSACMYSGGTVYISSGHSILSFGTLGVRGNGGVCALGSEAASAGGDGVVRIALVHGRGK